MDNNILKKVAVCISTSHREKEYRECILNWADKTSLSDVEIRIFVVEDGSNYSSADYRFQDNVGVAKVKNKCIELAVEWGADEVFLSDDDIWPISYDWYNLYSSTGINHLMYNYYDKGIVHGKVKSHRKVNGCLLYFKRICFETVGGFDTRYGMYGWEHIDLSRRIYNSGLTPYRYMDAVYSYKVLYSLDEHKKTKSSIPKDKKEELISETYKFFIKQNKSKEYIDYKDETINTSPYSTWEV